MKKIVVFLCFFFTVFASTEKRPKIQFELFASYLPTNPHHLNLESDYWQNWLDFFNTKYWNYLIQKGKISHYLSSREGNFKKIRGQLLTGSALRFNLKEGFSISAGVRFWEGSAGDNLSFTYELFKGNQKVTAKEILFTDYRLSFEAQNLFVNFHYILPLKTKFMGNPLTFEVYSGIGYIVAKILVQWNERSHSEDSEEWETFYVDHFKNGTKKSLNFQTGARMDLYIGENFGFYLEGSLFYARFRGFKGNGSLSYGYRNSHQENYFTETFWTNEKWFLSKRDFQTEWGSSSFIYPTNNPSFLPYKFNEFELRLPPVYFAIGIFLQFI